MPNTRDRLLKFMFRGGIDYYVDATNGLDTNTGSSINYPWQTVAKVNASTFKPGDRILFKRGETWRESWIITADGILGRPVVYGAYGTGARPIITGCDILQTWTLYVGGVALFQDGFETGDTSIWSSETDADGDLNITAPAALVGSWGAAITIDDVNPAYIQDNTPAGEKIYRCRFYIDPNTLTMANADEFIIFQALTGASSVFFIKLQYFTVGGYKLWIYERDDSWVAQTYNPSITDAPHYVELSWKASTAPGANNGTFAAWVDGVAPAPEYTGIDNDTLSIDTLKMGAILEIDVGTHDTFYMDAFYSNNTGTPIGPTDPVAVANVYYATFDNPIDTYLLLEDGVNLTRVANLAAVNAAGKFWPNDPGNTIYCRCSDSADPDTHVMEIGTRYDTVNCDNRSYITFNDLHFHGAGGQYGRGFGLKRTVANPSHIILNRCEIDHCAYNGIQLNHVDGFPPITGFEMYFCDVHHNLDTGVWIIGESATARITGLLIQYCNIYANGLTTAASMGLFIQNCAIPRITHNFIYNNNGNLDWSDNLLLGGSSDFVIAYNWIYGGNHTGIHVDVGSYGLVYNNIVYGCAWNGIWFEEHQLGLGQISDIFHNTCWHNLHGLVFGPGSVIHEVSGVTCINNNFAFNRRANVELNDDVGADYITGNILNRNIYQTDPTDPLYLGEFLKDNPRVVHTFAQWQAETGWDINSLNTDPLLFNPAGNNFHLQIASPCIAAGDPTVGVLTDYDGVVRGAAVDIGAYEYV